MSMVTQAIMELNDSIKTVEDNLDGTFTCWDEDWNVVTLSDAQLTAAQTKGTELSNTRKLENLRRARDKRLAETDYWRSPDLPDMTQAQLDYRQALRDITDSYSSLDTVVWPTKP